MNTTVYRIVLIGPRKVGKTFVLSRYSKNELPKEYERTIFGNEICSVTHRNSVYELHFSDTCGDQDDSMRSCCYEGVDAFVLCFSITDPESLEDIQNFWVKEVDESIKKGRRTSKKKNVVKLLVGCKLDLREDPESILSLKKTGGFPISSKLGENVSRRMDCDAYFETSSKLNKGIKELFLFLIDLLSGRVNSPAKKGKKKKKKGGGLFASVGVGLSDELGGMNGLDISDDEDDDVLI